MGRPVSPSSSSGLSKSASELCTVKRSFQSAVGAPTTHRLRVDYAGAIPSTPFFAGFSSSSAESKAKVDTRQGLSLERSLVRARVALRPRLPQVVRAHLRVDLCGHHIAVAEQFLHHANVRP